ncbi:hypothetical protein ACE7GA_06045 [Roseomonas sp. CCTCC AB2023176]|uniref:hypothetical protein n=1 Tax=Roseomonas sp. CCTCC AB2023176 TaxID=3342640 RepID=UPI0035DBE669
MDYVNSIIPWQFGMTFLAVIGVLIWYLKRARDSRAARGEQGHVSHPPPDQNTPQNRTP